MTAPVTPVRPVPTLRMDGRRVLVTGSSRGIGRGLAEAFVTAGADVTLHGSTSDGAAAAAAEVRELVARVPGAGTVTSCAFRVETPADAEQALADLAGRDGWWDVLVNNAGIQARGPLLDLSQDDWDRVIAVNLTGAFTVARTVARAMVERGSGKVINIASVQSSVVRPTTAPYAASKGGIVQLTRAMCAEWAPAGVQVNALAPGYLRTDLNAALVDDPAFSDWITGRTPARRWGEIEDLVGPALWLASDASRFVNGQVIYVDGGLTAVI